MQKFNRPKIKLTPNLFDKLLDGMSWICAIAIWVITFLNYSNLPDLIPIHYNFAGEPDRYGSKNTLFLLPIISTILFTSITLLNRVPHVFNYPVEITAENAVEQYTLGTRMLRIVKLICSFVFFILVYKTTQPNQQTIGAWFAPAVITVICGSTAYFLVKAFKKK